ncbi:MAG: type 4a pilus biogenesis protein PilO [Patescibacteria group bacterium]|nr:type 4a pilus biogenesis protein PilO [Patescibacteria group bacterium]MCL5224043.1 type 4a pilus biogenesis protein PilO [Patescibacteria group bacterium]
MPREFKVKFALSVGITLALLAVIVIAMLYIHGDLSNNSAAIAQINQAIASKDNTLKNLNLLEQQQPLAAPLLAKMDAAVPSQDMLFTLQQNMQAMAKSDNLSFSSQFGSQTPSTNSTPGYVAISMTVQGSYSSILAFLEGIEGSTGFVSVSGVDITQQSSSNNFNAIISGNIPFHD